MEVTDNFTKGNERFYGYCIDLLKEIVNNSDFKFEYTISVVPDHLYGHKNEKGEWTGMIGELVSKVRSDQVSTSSIIQVVFQAESRYCARTHLSDGRTRDCGRLYCSIL